MSDDITPTGEAIKERGDKIKRAILELAHNNPLLGKGPKEMQEINARNVHYQDALREGMVASLLTTGNPVGGFNGAMTALLFALAQNIDDERARESMGYILSLSEAIKSLEDGPMAIINGELNVECLLKPGDTPSDEVREHFNLPEGPVTEGATINVKREGNVVDATEMFAARGGKPTVH